MLKIMNWFFLFFFFTADVLCLSSFVVWWSELDTIVKSKFYRSLTFLPVCCPNRWKDGFCYNKSPKVFLKHQEDYQKGFSLLLLVCHLGVEEKADSCTFGFHECYRNLQDYMLHCKREATCPDLLDIGRSQILTFIAGCCKEQSHCQFVAVRCVLHWNR